MFVSFHDLGIEYYRINPELPLSEQKPVDAIIHKLIDQLAVPGEENEKIVAWTKSTRKLHPKLLFIDSLEQLDLFLRRSYSYEIATQAIHNGNLESVLSIPKYAFLPKGESILELLQRENLSLPILVKPQWTTGDPLSHSIDVIISPSSLPSSYDTDMVVQEYKDHNGVIYKAYAISDEVFLEKRYSLPNVADCSDPVDRYTIDRLKKCPQTFSRDGPASTKNNEIIHDVSAETEFLTIDLVKRFAVEIERLLKMDLIGIDFIIDSSNPQNIFCIDINLFPSYTGFPDVSTVFGRYILKRCNYSCLLNEV